MELLKHFRYRNGNCMRTFNLVIKRIIDIGGSIIGLILTLPLLVIISIFVKLTSKGPVFFRQERLGKHGKVFKIIKFRTMVENAENIGDGLIVRTVHDNRITQVGRILRAISIDELPQLWNVLIGDMSLVGPRPPVPYHPYNYCEYTDLQRKRFEMKPGITGLAQVTTRNSVPWHERILVDLKYIENFNIWLDIKILYKTIFRLFLRDNLYAHDNIDCT